MRKTTIELIYETTNDELVMDEIRRFIRMLHERNLVKQDAMYYPRSRLHAEVKTEGA